MYDAFEPKTVAKSSPTDFPKMEPKTPTPGEPGRHWGPLGGRWESLVRVCGRFNRAKRTSANASLALPCGADDSICRAPMRRTWPWRSRLVVVPPDGLG